MKKCPWCSKERETFRKIYKADKKTRQSEEIEICSDCEDDIERPFQVYVKSGVVRAFIQTVRDRGMYVKETIHELMKGFVDGQK